jgi:hypothetical protein
MTFFHDGHIQLIFDELLVKIEKRLGLLHVPDILNVNGDDVRKLLVQRIASITQYPFCEHCARHVISTKNIPDLTGRTMFLNGIALKPNSGEITLARKIILKEFLRLSWTWIENFAAIFAGLFLPEFVKIESATLFFDLGINDVFFEGTDRRFSRFCGESNVLPLKHARKILVQLTGSNSANKSTNRKITYANKITLHLISRAKIGVSSRLKILLGYLWLSLSALAWVKQLPMLLLLYKDIIEYYPLYSINKFGLIDDVLTTISSTRYQPLWMRNPDRRFSIHQLHYAQNSKPYLYRTSNLSVCNPLIKRQFIDEHWIWTNGYKNYLSGLAIKAAAYHIVEPPILWYLPEPSLNRFEDELRVALFDITPVCNDVSLKLGRISNYACKDNMAAFIKQSLVAINSVSEILDRPIRILYKRKRPPTSNWHDPDYLEYVQDLIDGNELFEDVDCQINLFSLLSSCDISITFPFSSPAYISNYVGTSAIYFDVTQNLLPNYDPLPLIKHASGYSQLIDMLQSILRNKD